MKKLLLLFVCTALTAQFAAAQVKKEGGSVTFEKVETEAMFPGGSAAFLQFLQKNLDANVPVKNRAKAGMYTVIVRFIVGKDGKCSDFAAETKFGRGMEKEVIRVLKLSPDWIPAQQDGKTVRAYRRQPVTFAVTNE